MEIIDFSLILGKLKKLKRTGWIKHNIPFPESVAEHSFRVAVLAMFLAPNLDADVNKSVKMALLHDIGEAEVGDVITERGKKILNNLPSKLKKERNALKTILSLINKQEYLELFDEFEENKTKEAQLVKQLDKLEMAIQAYEYEKEHKINLEEFFENSETAIKNPYLKKILSELEKSRK